MSSTNPRRRVVMWRHGQTEWNLQGRFQGQSDIPLTERGRQDARRAATLLASLRPDAIVSSDLSRAAETAAVLGDATGLTVQHDNRLREFYAGFWQGLTGVEIGNGYPEERAAWLNHDLEVRPGVDGETRVEVAERMAAAVSEAVQQLPEDGLLVVVSHGGAIRLGQCVLMGLPLEYHSVLGVLGNCSWVLLSEMEETWRLEEHNAGTLPEPVAIEEG
jgi:broad specificity phosphatase PhoE